MKKLLVPFCLTLIIFIGSVGVSESADMQKGNAAYDRGDYATALREWKPLAKQGDAAAQYNLGMMYYKGQGVPQNDKTALTWFRLAAEQGYDRAQYSLGLMYGSGTGVTQDWVYAHMWGNIAAKNGNKLGANLRNAVTKQMTPAQIAEAKKLFSECVRRKYKGC